MCECCDYDQSDFGNGFVVKRKKYICVVCGEAFSITQLIDGKTPKHKQKNTKIDCLFKGEVKLDPMP